MSNSSECINTVYGERNKFIIVGLTGRTGSGCTEAAQILKKETFENLDLREPKNQNYINTDERKYKIIYDYAKENWNGFYIINMSDIIFSFVLQCEFKDLNHIIENIVFNKGVVDAIIEKLKSTEDFENSYNKYHKELMELLSDDNILNRDSDVLEREFCLLNKIKHLQSIFKKILEQFQCQIKEQKETKDGKKCEEEFTVNVYTYLYQQFGNLIRSSGNVKNNEFNSNSMFHLARRANGFIKAIRYHYTENKQPTLICIDAIRNPYEAYYFKDRYSAFYLVSINTEDEERRRRLSSNLTTKQINSLDRIEYPSKLEGTNLFVNQNIAACLEISDIHIYNPISSTVEKLYLTEQLIKYIMLMKHPGLVAPTHIERCMQLAYNAKLNSGCLSRQVGAVITDENYSIKAVGWNNVPDGQVPCNLRDINDLYINRDYETFSKFEVEDVNFNKEITSEYNRIKDCNIGGRCYHYCFKDMYEKVSGKKNQVHTRSLHAEENAFLQIVKYGGAGIEGGNLFTTASPCELCSKKAYQLGIKKIYYIDPYPGISNQHILAFKSTKNNNPKMYLFYGAIGKAYTSLYSQRLSIKDELKLLTDNNKAKDICNDDTVQNS